MKVKSIYYYLLLLPLFSITLSCNEFEVPTYSAERTIIFVAKSGEYASDYALSRDYSEIFSKDTVVVDSVQIRVQGLNLVESVRIKLTTENIEVEEGQEPITPCTIVFDEEFVTMNPGENSKWVYFHHTDVKGGASAINIAFHSDSDLKPGDKDRQKFTVNVSDFLFDWDELNYTEENYNAKIAPFLGAATPMKIKFMLHYPESPRTTLSSYATYLNYSEYYKNYIINGLNKALAHYNEAFPNSPLVEADGTPVTFEPAP